MKRIKLIRNKLRVDNKTQFIEIVDNKLIVTMNSAKLLKTSLRVRLALIGMSTNVLLSLKIFDNCAICNRDPSPPLQ